MNTKCLILCGPVYRYAAAEPYEEVVKRWHAASSHGMSGERDFEVMLESGKKVTIRTDMVEGVVEE